MSPRQKNIIIGIIGVIVIFIALAIIFKKPVSKPIVLEMWGIYDEPEIFLNLINSFQKTHPLVKIKYTAKDADAYHTDLIWAFANNKSPDIFMLPGNSLPFYQNHISPLNLTKDKDLNLRILRETYPQIIQDELIANDNLWAIPLSIDTLALYYNKDIFNYYKIALPPQTWQDVLALIPKLRKVNPQGQLTRAAIALGTSNNVSWSADILSALMMQLGSPMADIQSKRILFNDPIKRDNKKIIPGEEALKHYIQFANPKSSFYTWTTGFPNSILAFSQGKTAMIIGYNQARKIIQKYSPDLKYGVAAFPLIGSAEEKINYGSTMNAVVFNRTQYIQESWQFLKYLGEYDSAKYYFLQTKNPPARLDLFSLAITDPQAGPFASQILTSRNWYQINFQEINSILNNAVNEVIFNNISPQQAINTAVSKIELLWRKKP